MACLDLPVFYFPFLVTLDSLAMFSVSYKQAWCAPLYLGILIPVFLTVSPRHFEGDIYITLSLLQD